MTTDVKKQKQFQKVEFASFETTARELGVSADKLCETLGYAGHSHAHWKETGVMPKVASLACEALRRRQPNGHKAEVWLVKVETQNQRQALEALCKGLGCEFVSVS